MYNIIRDYYNQVKYTPRDNKVVISDVHHCFIDVLWFTTV